MRTDNIMTRRRFTLVEVLVAMTVFLAMSVVMMRLFNAARGVYSNATQRNQLYADARIALDLIARDLQCAMYNNEDSVQGIFPFWFRQCTPKDSPITDNYYEDGLSVTELNFIAATDSRPAAATSHICELRYTFVPAGQTLVNPDGSEIPGGWLVRSCTGNDNAARYNFADHPFDGADNSRLNRIWIARDNNVPGSFLDSPTLPSHENFQRVIPHVYNLRFTCYTMDYSVSPPVMKTLMPLHHDGTLNDASGQVGGYNRRTGTPFPVAVKIDLQMLAAGDWNAWMAALEASPPDTATAYRIRRQKLRTFSKMIYLSPRN